MVVVLENSRVAPPPGTVAGASLPLTFFDLMLFNFPTVEHIFFFDFPHSNPHFSETVIPNLKASLSVALQHFFPLAGNLIIFADKSTKPVIRYEEGDSVSLIVAESGKDFNHLAGNQPRVASEFHDLIPRIPEAAKVFDESQTEVAKAIPLLAIQVTLFPGVGFPVGLTYQHMTIDGKTFFHFLQSWASISEFGRENHPSEFCPLSLPSYDRTAMPDPDGRLENIFWNHGKGFSYERFNFDQQYLINKIRATFVLTNSDVQLLKNSVLTRRPNLPRVSTFTIACAYSWICRVKSGAAMEEEEDDDDELEFFGCTADCRGGRTNPPIPENYFGNCLSAVIASAKRSVLVGEEGFVVAVESIGEAIAKRLSNNGEGLFEGAETLFSDWKDIKLDRVLSVAGSPRFPVYELDFGFGKPKKREIVSTDATGAISLTKTKNSEGKGGVEIGLSLPIDQMSAFSAIFAHGLKTIG